MLVGKAANTSAKRGQKSNLSLLDPNPPPWTKAVRRLRVVRSHDWNPWSPHISKKHKLWGYENKASARRKTQVMGVTKHGCNINLIEFVYHQLAVTIPLPNSTKSLQTEGCMDYGLFVPNSENKIKLASWASSIPWIHLPSCCRHSDRPNQEESCKSSGFPVVPDSESISSHVETWRRTGHLQQMKLQPPAGISVALPGTWALRPGARWCCRP